MANVQIHGADLHCNVMPGAITDRKIIMAIGGLWYAIDTGFPTDGSSVNPVIAFPVLQNIDALQTGTTLMGTTENKSRRFYPTNAMFTLTAKTGTMLTVATLSIGTNAANYNNVVAATALSGVVGVNNMLRVAAGNFVIDSIAPNAGIYCNVTIPAAGIGLTVVTAMAALEGYYI